MVGRDEGLERIEALGAPEHHLAVSVTTARDGSPQVALVNFGIVPDPASGEPRVAFVSRPGAKLANLRRHPHATLVVRSGWEWMAVSGAATLAGPDDPLPGLDDDGLRVLLRDIFAAAGGSHPDLDEYDAAMRAERRCAVLVTPERFVTNPTESEHRELGEA